MAASSEAARVWTVSEVTQAVKTTLEETFFPFWLGGEIGNLTIHRSGHVYFSLKDRRCQISAVFFRGAGVARQLELHEGMAVDVYGRLTVYEARGSYQVSVSEIRPRGLGTLQAQFEKLKAMLHAQGLFDEARKRPLPLLPRCVGVVTSPDGAALRDFLQIINRRYADMHVRIYPTAVQGAGAADGVASGIQFFNQHRACDVIVVTRGGGSLEDLWAFNEEPVARAVAQSAIPVISAVGHEVDFTICDFVADMRVPTPSAAAELVVGQKAELTDRVATANRRLASALRLQLATLRQRVHAAANHYVFREPANVVRQFQQEVDEFVLRIHHALERQLSQARDRVGQLKGELRLLNPRDILNRGYAILLDSDDNAVTRADSVSRDAELRGVLASGELKVRVTGRITGDDRTGI